jgi:hypothetical protein
MLLAHQRGPMGPAHDLTLHGAPLTLLTTRLRDGNSDFEFAGHRYEVRTSFLSRRYDLVSNEWSHAVADGIGRKRWTVAHAWGVHGLARARWGDNSSLQLLAGDVQVGHVRRTSMWRLDAEAELSVLPPLVQVFTVAVVLSLWRKQAAAAVMTM